MKHQGTHGQNQARGFIAVAFLILAATVGTPRPAAAASDHAPQDLASLDRVVRAARCDVAIVIDFRNASVLAYRNRSAKSARAPYAVMCAASERDALKKAALGSAKHVFGFDGKLPIGASCLPATAAAGEALDKAVQSALQAVPDPCDPPVA